MQWLGCPLGSPHPISECLVWVQATLLPIQLSAGVNPGEAANDGSRSWVPNTHMGDLGWVLGSCPALVVAGIWAVNPWMEGLSPSVSSNKMKINKKLKWKKKLQKEQTPTYLAGSYRKDSKWHFSELFMNMLICFPLFTSPLAFGHLIPPQWLLAFLTCIFKCLLSSWPS